MTAATITASRVDLRRTRPRRHLLIPRIIVGVPLLGIGLVHVVAEGFGMRRLVEAAGLPLAFLLASVAVAAEIVAGIPLLLGAWARLGALLAIPAMVVAVYAHLAIDVWPNAGDEPPLALPLVVMVCAAYVLSRGAGRCGARGDLARVAGRARHAERSRHAWDARLRRSPARHSAQPRRGLFLPGSFSTE